MKIDTRKDCQQMSAQECYIRKNKAIPESSYSHSKEETQALLGREVLYEPIVIQSPVLVSTRLQAKANNVRLSKKYMRKMNDMMDEFAIHKLADSVGGLLISKKDGAEEEYPSAQSTMKLSDPDEEVRERAATAPKDDASDTKTLEILGKDPSTSSLGRVQIKILDEGTKKEVVVSRCVRFMDAEEAEI